MWAGGWFVGAWLFLLSTQVVEWWLWTVWCVLVMVMWKWALERACRDNGGVVGMRYSTSYVIIHD